MPRVELTGKEMVPADWCDGKSLTLDDYAHRQWESGLDTGVGKGLALAKSRLLAKATEAFMLKDDKMAATLRDIAEEITKDTGAKGPPCPAPQ